MKKLIGLLLCALSPISHAIADPEKKEWCESMKEEREIYLKYPNLSDYVPPTSGVMSPFPWNESLSKLSSNEVAASLSGYYCDSPNNHPLIFAHGGGFTVIGVGYVESFGETEFEAAVAAYGELLRVC
jgi:hypothetical protein